MSAPPPPTRLASIGPQTLSVVAPVGPWRWLRRAGPLLLILGSAFTAPLVRPHGITLTGDRLLGLLALAAVAALGVRGRLGWTGVHSALAVFVAAQALTTALNAAVWPDGLKFVTVYLLGFACFALAAECARSADGQRRMVGSWIAVGAIVAVVGTLMATVSNVRQTQFWGSGPAQLLVTYTGQRRVVFAAKATFAEWNLFSSFLLIAFALGLWAWRRETRGQRSLITAVAATVFGLVSGVTRAAWVSLAAITWLWWRVRRPRRRQLGALAVMLALAFLLQALALRGTSPLESRLLDPVLQQYDWNMVGRLVIARATVESWLRRPVLGHGAGSTNRLSVVLPNGTRLAKVWNGNLVLFVLHDSGLLGLAALVGLGAVVWRRARRAIGRGIEGATLPSPAVPLLAAGGALCFAYQFTHGLWLMYPYVYLGFLTAVTERGAGEA